MIQSEGGVTSPLPVRACPHAPENAGWLVWVALGRATRGARAQASNFALHRAKLAFKSSYMATSRRALGTRRGSGQGFCIAADIANTAILAPSFLLFECIDFCSQQAVGSAQIFNLLLQIANLILTVVYLLGFVNKISIVGLARSALSNILISKIADQVRLIRNRYGHQRKTEK